MRKDIIKPIETEYNGYLFRSKLEAQWAVVFDSLGIRYEYEPEGFELEDGTKYLPDFYFPDQDTYGEVKPDRPGALEELFDKSLKFVENGMIERLIILPNIPAATEEDSVWWVPLIVKNPFVPVPYNEDWPFSDIIVTRAMFYVNGINMYNYVTLGQIETDFHIEFHDYIVAQRHHQNPSKISIRNLHVSFLQAIPSRKTEYVIRRAESNPETTIDDVLEESRWEHDASIERAYQKARQARFDHGQTPEAKRAG